MKLPGSFTRNLIILLLLAVPLAATPAAGESEEKSGEEKNLSVFEAGIVITLSDGRTVKGKTTFEGPSELMIRHTIDGIQYEKKVKMKDVRSVTFEKWQPRLTGKNQKGKIYQFDVIEFSITDDSGNRYLVKDKLYPFWKMIRIENKHGQVPLYSYWVDLLRDDGSWFTGMEGPVSQARSFAHKDVIRSIEFGKQ